ncbi:MAG: hypothetical protein COS92_03730 [Desulfobacterales bacterium CG07_land_8_20_14_0_80_52_14]|nr:MAG: hypothetical protein COX20_13030 [Desulfobacterales bacterium CG23_combo_of_CG06-09_8_20_14_all_52_9]PIU49993.1 MAG: hypothetical protein COS92_03730 [Desulfobacterales bacterium CG07_land_8_20_14_0_80_52_14]
MVIKALNNNVLRDRRNVFFFLDELSSRALIHSKHHRSDCMELIIIRFFAGRFSEVTDCVLPSHKKREHAVFWLMAFQLSRPGYAVNRKLVGILLKF